MLDKKKLKKLKERAAKLHIASEEPTGIPCSFLEQTEFGWVVNYDEGPRRCGSYHGSVWNEVKGFGATKWVVGGYVAVDYDSLRSSGMSDEDILRGCVEFLNCPPNRKKYAKRTPKPLYGTVEDMPIRHKFMELDGNKCIMMMLVTDQRKNKNFHGEGQVIGKKLRRKKLD